MAKKINIAFSAQPVTGVEGFNYSIQVSGFDIIYSSGADECKINFIPNGDTPAEVFELPIGLTLDDTLQATLSFLRENYINDLISYSLNENTIEVLIEADAVVTINDVNDNIDITTEDIEPSGSNLIYYLLFDDYTLNIYKNNYQGNATRIYGSFSIKKSSVDSILTPIRGTGLQLYLEANKSITFADFALAKEFTYKTELLNLTDIVFKGYIKPDGIQQNYVANEWLINIESTDSLGALKDLSFVQANGLRFTGKMSLYEVIKGCLDRTKLSMDINTSVNLEYIGYTGTNILKDSYVNSDRYIKDKDDSVLMDCNEVLTSVLNMFSAVITQEDGQWWICRPNDLVVDGYTEFINQTTNTTFLKNLNADLGSQINNFNPHHCDSNQQIEVKGAISAYRLNYKYGFIDGFIINTNLNHDDSLIYSDWIVNPLLPPNILVNDPLNPSGALMKSRLAPTTFSLTEVMESNTFAGFENQVLTFRAKVTTNYRFHGFYFKIKTSDGYFLNNQNEWVLGESTKPFVRVNCGRNFVPAPINADYELLMPPLLNDCDVSVIICRPHYDDVSVTYNPGIGEVTYCQILDNEIQKQGIVGEFHTVTRFDPPSSITKENQKVYNGDGTAILIGSIYKSDQTTLTDLWTRNNKFENLPLLGISAMDDLRIQANPIQVFSGSIYGYIPYLSVVKIDGVTGVFMFIEYDYDYKSNKIQAKLMQFYNDDIAAIEYIISPDYGNNTIKPTIKS